MGNFFNSKGYKLNSYDGFGMPSYYGPKIDLPPYYDPKIDLQYISQNSCPNHDQNDNQKHSKIQDLSSVVCMK